MPTLDVLRGKSSLSKAEAIFNAAFKPIGPSPSRSTQYMQGAYASLINAASAKDTNFKLHTCPYNEGECAFDAWHAGAERGRFLWRVNGCVI